MVDPLIWPTPSVDDGFAGVTNASTIVVVANDNRTDLEIVNDSDIVVYLARGNAAVIGSGIRLNANGGSYTMDMQNLYHGYFAAICATDANITISEGEAP